MIDNPYKELLSALAIALTFIAFAPYIRGILKDTIRPHLFSWLIWASTTLIVFFASIKSGAGIGAWPIGVSGLIVLLIALLAYQRVGDRTITRLDWGCLIAAMSSLPFWYFTANPLWAVVILTTVDLLGFGPTLRKAYHYPHEEGLSLFAIYTFRNLLVIGALEHYSITTVLFPAAVALACMGVIMLVLYRRERITTPMRS